MPSPCKHPRVRVVSREDDVEFVECQDCGEVFDSDEFRDMEIEEKAGLAAPDPQQDTEPDIAHAGDAPDKSSNAADSASEPNGDHD
jgi:hypothetical protein